MGNLYRFVEPVVLLRAALDRTLRQLELNGNVASEWETDQSGPARRVYRLAPQGEQHLDAWATVLDHVSKSMARFVIQARLLAAGVTRLRNNSCQ